MNGNEEQYEKTGDVNKNLNYWKRAKKKTGVKEISKRGLNEGSFLNERLLEKGLIFGGGARVRGPGVTLGQYSKSWAHNAGLILPPFPSWLPRISDARPHYDLCPSNSALSYSSPPRASPPRNTSTSCSSARSPGASQALLFPNLSFPIFLVVA